MLKICFALLCLLWLPALEATEQRHDALSTPQNKKLLVLIAASDNHTAFFDLQHIWRSYMHSDPEHIEVYFVKGDPTIQGECEIIGDTIYCKIQDSYRPGMLQKTVMSMEFLLEKIKQCDYVLRTNLSSFYHFPRLLKFLDTLPKRGCYCAQGFVPSHADVTPEYYNIPFGWGAGFILSPDLVEMLVQGKEEVLKDAAHIPDDVMIGAFFFRRGVPLLPEKLALFHDYADWAKRNTRLADDIFHFKAKKQYFARKVGDEYEDEYRILTELLDRFYPTRLQDNEFMAEISYLADDQDDAYYLMDGLAATEKIDRSSLMHNYTKFYAQYFKDCRDQPLRLLEIGIFEGNSVKFFENYFPNADLHFIDNQPQYIKYFSERSKYHTINQSDIPALQTFSAEQGPFDVIIDDGGHTMTNQINSFLALFPSVKPGGLYIIESLHTSYWLQFGGSGNPCKADENTTVGFLKNLIDHLNFIGATSQCADVDKAAPGVNTPMNDLRKQIHSIRFYPCVCIIEKNK